MTPDEGETIMRHLASAVGALQGQDVPDTGFPSSWAAWPPGSETV